MRTIPILLAVVTCISWCSVASALQTPPTNEGSEEIDSAQLDFFESRIRPILVDHCYTCHAVDAEEPQAGLFLDSRSGLRRGGDSGPALIPGKPEESLLLEAMRYESYEMPPSGQLPDDVIADFESWIRDGAIDPRDDAGAATTVPSMELARDFWSFRPLQPVSVPGVERTGWPVTQIDRFVLAELEKRQLSPAADADRNKLVRRLFFDLTGLPPQPADIALFSKNDADLGALVDRLIDSPQFGERWGRHWLDVARYSDSSGGGRVLMFHEAWRYRDYVVAAFNNDKPIDEFIRQQIAGDLLPSTDYRQRQENLIATGFLMLGPHNYELQDKELLRMEVVDEQIDVTGRAFLGLTLGCARCHDHKFDPVPTSDYYSLAGIFRSTKSLEPGNVSRFVETELPLDSEEQAKLNEYRNIVAELQHEVKTIDAQLQAFRSRLEGQSQLDPTRLPGIVVDDESAQMVGSWQRSNSVKPFVGAGYQYANALSAKATFSLRAPRDGNYEVLVSHTPHPNRSPRVRVAVTAAGRTDEHFINQQEMPSGGLFTPLGSLGLSVGDQVSVEIRADRPGTVIIDAVQLVDSKTAGDDLIDTGNEDAKLTELLAQIKERQKVQSGLKKQLSQLRKLAPVEPPRVMSVKEESVTEDFYVCVRGNVHRLGARVPRRALSVLPLDPSLSISEQESGRLQLAKWLVSAENPLTARVYVNRVWSKLLGHGLVRTPDNFGLMGESPSHPALLDHLALRFMENGWSTKWLIREIVASRVYQIGAANDPAGAEVDPENRLLWRAHRRRLDAEALRDAILIFSGQLDPQMGGPAMARDVNSEFGYQYQSSRRTLYLPVFRNTLYDMLEVFDFPNPNLVAGKRSESTLPAQALFLMNSPFVLEQSQAAARRILDEEGLTPREKIDLAYQLALARLPADDEREIILSFLREYAGGDDLPRLKAWTDVCHSLISSLDFRYLD